MSEEPVLSNIAALEELASLFDAPVLLLDHDRRVVYLNEGAASTTGCPAAFLP